MSERAPRILIVDDDDGVRQSVARIVRLQGYDVYTACDGPTAIAMVPSIQPDLLIIDIRMPGIDGVETFREIRRLQPSLAAIFMTAYAVSDRASAAIDSGALSVMAKPLNIPQFCTIVSDALREAPVLVVDDDAALLASLARSLRSSGIEVETASSLAAAVLLVRKRPERVVLADVYLEDGYGHQLLSELLQDTRFQSLILISGFAERFAATSSPDRGDVLCIPKPLNIEELVARMRRLLGDRRAASRQGIEID